MGNFPNQFQSEQDYYEYLQWLTPEVFSGVADFEMFLKLITPSMFRFYNLTENFNNLVNVDNCPRKFLPHLAKLVGFDYRDDLEPFENRIIIKNILELYRNRATVDRIKQACVYYGDIPKTLLDFRERDFIKFIEPIDNVFRFSISKLSGKDHLSDCYYYRNGVFVVEYLDSIENKYSNFEIQNIIDSQPAGTKSYIIRDIELAESSSSLISFAQNYLSDDNSNIDVSNYEINPTWSLVNNDESYKINPFDLYVDIEYGVLETGVLKDVLLDLFNRVHNFSLNTNTNIKTSDEDISLLKTVVNNIKELEFYLFDIMFSGEVNNGNIDIKWLFYNVLNNLLTSNLELSYFDISSMKLRIFDSVFSNGYNLIESNSGFTSGVEYVPYNENKGYVPSLNKTFSSAEELNSLYSEFDFNNLDSELVYKLKVFLNDESFYFNEIFKNYFNICKKEVNELNDINLYTLSSKVTYTDYLNLNSFVSDTKLLSEFFKDDYQRVDKEFGLDSIENLGEDVCKLKYLDSFYLDLSLGEKFYLNGKDNLSDSDLMRNYIKKYSDLNEIQSSTYLMFRIALNTHRNVLEFWRNYLYDLYITNANNSSCGELNFYEMSNFVKNNKLVFEYFENGEEKLKFEEAFQVLNNLSVDNFEYFGFFLGTYNYNFGSDVFDSNSNTYQSCFGPFSSVIELI